MQPAVMFKQSLWPSHGSGHKATSGLLLPGLIFKNTALDVEHGHLDNALHSPQQMYVVLKGVSLAELHVSVDARPADHGSQEAPLLSLLAVTDRDVILDAPADVDDLRARAPAHAGVGELLEPLRGRVLGVLGYV